MGASELSGAVSRALEREENRIVKTRKGYGRDKTQPGEKGGLLYIGRFRKARPTVRET